MSRLSKLVAVLIAATFAQPALAADQTSWSAGIGSIGIQSATPIINVSVQNLSNSPYASERKLTNTTAPPLFTLDGQVFCKAILSGSTRLVKSQVMFGNPIVTYGNQGTYIMPIGVWDSSAPLINGGNNSSANVHFDHHIDLPTTWSGGLITLGFNPVKVVEDRLANYVSNGGSAVDFLRTDDVFDVQVSANLIGECENTSSYGVHRYVGYTRRTIIISIFYRGDSRIQYEPVGGGPGTIQTPTLPKDFTITSSSGAPTRLPTFARYPQFDGQRVTYAGAWAGWATTSSDTCSGRPTMAATPEGACVFVESCVPVEFDSCKTLNGCCEAPLIQPTRAATATR